MTYVDAWGLGKKPRRRGIEMDDGYMSVAEKLVHARPVNEAEARRALEWIASREGKPLDELVREHRQGDTIAA